MTSCFRCSVSALQQFHARHPECLTLGSVWRISSLSTRGVSFSVSFYGLVFFFFFFNFQLFSASFVLVCLFSLFSRFGGIYGNCACCYFSLLSFDLTSILRLIAFIFIKHDGQYAAPVSFLLLPAFGLTSLATLIPRVWFETVTGCSGATWFCWGWMG